MSEIYGELFNEAITDNHLEFEALMDAINPKNCHILLAIAVNKVETDRQRQQFTAICNSLGIEPLPLLAQPHRQTSEPLRSLVKGDTVFNRIY